jgi:hypothetical protein
MIAQRIAIDSVIARRLKTVEKLFMTICEKIFSARELRRFGSTHRDEGSAHSAQLRAFSRFKMPNSNLFLSCVS